MPPKKSTEQSKRTHSTSPTTSTFHGPVDTHHRLRHAGPAITTRSRTASSKPPASAHPEPTSGDQRTAESSHEKTKPSEVSPPGARTPLTKFLYVLLIVVLSLFAWYIYGMITLLGKLKEEVGWWGIIVGDSGGVPGWVSEWGGFGSNEAARARPSRGGSLESTLNALADALGISPVQVASAVRPLVPEASLTSMASRSEETGRSEAVRILFEDMKRNDGEREDTTRIVREFAERMGSDATEENVAEEDIFV